jgi:hypothetical protein
MIPSFREDLQKSSLRKEKAQRFLAQTTIALNSIVEFEEKIAETNLKYKELINNSGEQGCADRQNLLQNAALLSKKYNLYEPIKVEIARSFEAGPVQKKNSEVKLNNYQAIINFSVSSSLEVMNLSKDICTLLPPGSLVLKAEVRKNQTLTPEIINKLSPNGAPGLIDVSMIVLLRDVIYEK